MIQFDVYVGKIAGSTIKGFGVVDYEVFHQLLNPNVPRKKGFNNLQNRIRYMYFRYS